MRTKYFVMHTEDKWAVIAFFVGGRYLGYTAKGAALALMSAETKHWWDFGVPASEDRFVELMGGCPRVVIKKEKTR